MDLYRNNVFPIHDIARGYRPLKECIFIITAHSCTCISVKGNCLWRHIGSKNLVPVQINDRAIIPFQPDRQGLNIIRIIQAERMSEEGSYIFLVFIGTIVYYCFFIIITIS